MNEELEFSLISIYSTSISFEPTDMPVKLLLLIDEFVLDYFLEWLSVKFDFEVDTLFLLFKLDCY